MNLKKQPLTERQKIFAEQYYNYADEFLISHHLPHDEYYDAAVLGYLEAVRIYLEQPSVQSYGFPSIASSLMEEHTKKYQIDLERAKKNDAALYGEHIPLQQVKNLKSNRAAQQITDIEAVIALGQLLNPEDYCTVCISLGYKTRPDSATEKRGERLIREMMY